MMIQSMEDAEFYFKKRKSYGIKPGLGRVNYLLKKLGNPEQNIQAIHVAGTNGKGSTIHFLENALTISGYQVGVFSSPSFSGLCGHMTVNQVPIEKSKFIQLLNMLIPSINELDEKELHPTEFEIITVLALLYFQNNVHIALIETGMGGKDDTTNCIDPLLSIITNVEKDHMQFLGNTYAQIAMHKAGIVKKNRPVIVGPINNESEQVIIQKAKEENALFYRSGKEFQWKELDNEYIWEFEQISHSYSIGETGIFQIENMSLALMALTLLERFSYKIAWHEFLKNSKSLTLPGRFEYICKQPKVILDSAHNLPGIKAFIQTVSKQFPKENKTLLFTAFKDKQIDHMLSELTSVFQQVTMTTFSHERAISTEQLKKYHNRLIKINKDWKSEIDLILQDKSNQNVYFVTGSMHFIMEVRNYLIKII